MDAYGIKAFMKQSKIYGKYKGDYFTLFINEIVKKVEETT